MHLRKSIQYLEFADVNSLNGTLNFLTKILNQLQVKNYN